MLNEEKLKKQRKLLPKNPSTSASKPIGVWLDKIWKFYAFTPLLNKKLLELNLETFWKCWSSLTLLIYKRIIETYKTSRHICLRIWNQTCQECSQPEPRLIDHDWSWSRQCFPLSKHVLKKGSNSVLTFIDSKVWVSFKGGPTRYPKFCILLDFKTRSLFTWQ